ncbi:hypothetical protein B0T24DRAFT_18981 [Lasiosphaeria ovina]|uniref:Rhodopsin domain-containing protein n=1 Tax=Lasiosphaeria ovina TaxID=92902 RepID=A0AAE0TX14_9PEZI|nr:hypothetical protein B0T24DRAFT_18981 [Lasiosphaeria ovina]
MGSVSNSLPTLANFSADYIAFNDGPVLVRTCIALSVVSALTVAVRFAVRWRSAMGLGWDDWLILAALPHLFSFAAMAILSVEYGGVGRHLDVVLAIDPAMFERTLLYLFVSEFNYFTLIAVIKASILVMYCRIFPSRFMKKGVWVIGVFVGVWWFATILVTLFQCKPIDKFFRPFMKEGMCLDTTKLFVGNSIINIISDIMILALPTHEVWRLQVPKPQKLAIWGVFILGFLAVVMTCIRLQSLINLVDGQADFTQFVAPAWIWTLAEPTVGLVTASLPTMRPLLRFVFGMTFSGRRHHRNFNRNPNADANNRGNEDAKGNDTIVTIGGGSFSRRVSLGLLPGKSRAQKSPKQASKSSGGSSSNISAAAAAADDMAINQDQRQHANRGPYDRLDEESQWYDMTPTNTAHTGRWPTPLASNPAASAATTNNYLPAPESPRYGGAHVQTVIYGARKPSVAASDEIPLDGISVTHDLRWAESRGE